ncbi:MAG: competence/damage-inducible protein A [Clostridiales bacterium]|nr:competence/damage-inducible protein A [Clostridiales bacterium]
MKAELIAIGTEILLGTTINSNAAMISALLSEMGIDVYWESVVGDNMERAAEAVRRAAERADIIITTGGLGPTCDDITKEAVAAAFGVGLEENREEKEWLIELFRARGSELTENNYSQIMLPEGSKPIRNSRGTAPGCRFEKDGKIVLMLPGPPHELEAMLNESVRGILMNLSGGIIVSHKLNLFGISESLMESKLRDYMKGLNNPTLAPYAAKGECTLRVTAKAESAEEAEKMMEPVIDRVKKTFGNFIYGMDYDGLEQMVIEQLIEKKLTLACAESCTGGLLSKRLSDIPGASKAFLGSVISYTNEVKNKVLGIPNNLIEEKGAVSEEVAAFMAMNVRELIGSSFGIGITGLAGPEGDGINPIGLVYIALSTRDSLYVRKVHVKARNRGAVRLYAGSHALDMIRRKIQGINVEEIV